MPFIGPWEIALIGVVVIVIFLYKIFRKPKPETKVCIGCGRSIPINSKFCSECGYSTHALRLGKTCPHCNFKNPIQAENFCVKCGYRLR